MPPQERRTSSYPLSKAFCYRARNGTSDGRQGTRSRSGPLPCKKPVPGRAVFRVSGERSVEGLLGR